MRVPLRTTWTELGALTSASAAAAMIVCCLPFATGLIGAGVAAAGAQFAPVQPYLTVTSLAFLAFAFYQAYRPQPSCANDACASSAAGRRRLVVWFVAVVVALLLTVERWANWVIYWTL